MAARRGARGGEAARRAERLVDLDLALDRGAVPRMVRAPRPARARVRLWTRRGELDAAHDNRPVAREILLLRHELARLHGYRSYADYALVDRMAKTPAAVARLLERVWGPAKPKAAVGARRAAGDGARDRRDARDRAVGLAPLRREGAPRALPGSTTPR
jgi:Zn-dependent oligopeptidase